jgi:hypothetical protein
MMRGKEEAIITEMMRERVGLFDEDGKKRLLEMNVNGCLDLSV